MVFPKTHALGELLDLCRETQPQFERFRSNAELLSPLVHQFRYPGDAAEPSVAEAEIALAAAEQIYDFCEQQLRDKPDSRK